ncbi:MAG: OsmC family protein [Saprospirales bacterium]|jgi:putative redox protein|nr:OsmC family protein [Saprospirales bacterium]MBK8922519.1 OsmC family protein [Saprospirales bacterium]
MTSSLEYNGDLHCTLTHLLSGVTIVTDAPPDNQGRGEAFSPTDLCATSLAACMLTTMAIRIRDRGIRIDGARAEVNKIMSSDPRRIRRIEVRLMMPANNYSEADKKLLEHIADTCPVALSLHPELEQAVTFVW